MNSFKHHSHVLITSKSLVTVTSPGAAVVTDHLISNNQLFS